MLTSCRPFGLVIGTFFVLLLSSVGNGAELLAGAAKVDITPEHGVSLDGPISKNGVVTGVNDPIQARALVFDDRQMRLAMVVCDVCMLERSVADEARKLIDLISSQSNSNSGRFR